MSIQTRPGVTTPTPPAATPRKRTHHRRRAAVAIATTAIGAGMTALVLGVTDGSEIQAPPSPGVAPVVVDAETMHGLDRRLYNLAEERAAERRALLKLAPGADRRLYNLAEVRAAERRNLLQLERGADQRLYNLAEE